MTVHIWKYNKQLDLPQLIVYLCFLDSAVAHIDEPCNLSICLNTFFVPIKNAYCDTNDNICKCNKGFVAVGRHKCSEFQEYGGQCEHENVCKATDENLVCDRTRYKPLCECRKGFYYEVQEKKCIPRKCANIYLCLVITI